MRKLAIVVCVGLVLIACSSTPRELPTISRIDLRVNGKDSVLDLKSGLMRVTSRVSSDPAYNYAKYGFTLGNFDLTDNKALERALVGNSAEIVFFELLGPSGSNKDTLLTTGTYSTEAPSLPKFENLSLAIFTIIDGKQIWTLSKTSPAFETHGQVTITAIEGDLIKGELELYTGNVMRARGNFVARRAFDKPNISKPE